jgi:hypothetical protein
VARRMPSSQLWKGGAEPVRDSWMSVGGRRALWWPYRPNAPVRPPGGARLRLMPRRSAMLPSFSAPMLTASGDPVVDRTHGLTGHCVDGCGGVAVKGGTEMQSILNEFETLIQVRRGWRDGATARYVLDAVSRWHWDFCGRSHASSESLVFPVRLRVRGDQWRRLPFLQAWTATAQHQGLRHREGKRSRLGASSAMCRAATSSGIRRRRNSEG